MAMGKLTVCLRLKKFNLDEMNPLAVLAIGVDRENLLVEGPLSRHQAIPTGLVMSATEMAQQILRGFRPRMLYPRRIR
jgi:hypothetical protein